MGKPTSDEAKKAEVRINFHRHLVPSFLQQWRLSQALTTTIISQGMAKFKAMHPEMDFTNTKFS